MSLMNPLIGRCLFSCICLFVVYCSGAQSKTADSLWAQGAFEQASVAYAQAVYQSPSPVAAVGLRYRWAQCQYAQGQYANTTNILSFINVYNLPAPVWADSILFLKAKAHFFNQKYIESQRAIMEYALFAEGQPLPKHFVLLKIMNHNALAEYEQAQQVLQAYTQQQQININTDSLYCQAINQKYKDPEKADLLSTFVPGLGQAYAGKVGRGLLSFTLVGSTLAFTGWQAYTAHYFTAFFTGSGLFNKFYWGGKTHSKYLAEQYNLKKNKHHNQTINRYLINQVFTSLPAHE